LIKHTSKNEKGAEKQFLNAYDAYAEKILRHAIFRVSDRNVAEDITSETFLKAWDYVRKSNEVKNFKGFLYQIANNLITDHYRAKKYQPIPLETVEAARLPNQTDLEENMESILSFQTVKDLLQSLPEDYRLILIYRYIDDLEISTIRKLTGKSLASIYVTIHRARKCLIEELIKKNES
jgi:RNA polymerase sigma-70 factor (ECF subfamily)